MLSCTVAARPATRGAARPRRSREAAGEPVHRPARPRRRRMGARWRFGSRRTRLIAWPSSIVGALTGTSRRLPRRRDRPCSPRGRRTASCRRPRHRGHHPSHQPRGDPADSGSSWPGVEVVATLDEAAAAIAAYTPNRPKRVNPAGLMKVLRQRRNGRWYWHWDPRFIEGGRTEVPRPGFKAPLDAALANIQVPTLLVRGKLSDVVTEEGAQEFLRRIPGARLVEVGGASHMVTGDRTTRSPGGDRDFLGGRPPRPCATDSHLVSPPRGGRGRERGAPLDGKRRLGVRVLAAVSRGDGRGGRWRAWARTTCSWAA